MAQSQELVSALLVDDASASHRDRRDGEAFICKHLLELRQSGIAQLRDRHPRICRIHVGEPKLPDLPQLAGPDAGRGLSNRRAIVGRAPEREHVTSDWPSLC